MPEAARANVQDISLSKTYMHTFVHTYIMWVPAHNDGNAGGGKQKLKRKRA